MFAEERKIDNNKDTSLLRYGIKAVKKFYSAGPWRPILYTFTITINTSTLRPMVPVSDSHIHPSLIFVSKAEPTVVEPVLRLHSIYTHS